MDKRVAAYCRVSTAYDDQMGSYDNQVEMYMNKIANNPDWQLADIYADPAVSGTTDKRPDFQRMLKDAENKTFDLLLVKSISRFARNTLVTIETIRHLQSLGIGCIFEKENIDTSSPYSEMMLTILSALAQEESRNISERVKKGIRMNHARGKVSWTPIYGYARIDGKPYTIVEYEANVIRRIFDDYNRGVNSKQILDWLNQEGIPSPGGSIWSGNTLADLIKNEKYAGEVKTNKYFIENHISHKTKRNKGEIEQYTIASHHEPIIDKETFETAQEIRKLRDTWTYPFGEYMICPNCGKKVKKRRPGWGCACGRFYIPKKRLEESVLKAYELLEDDTDPMTSEMKTEYPCMETIEYWWLKKLVEEITFDHDARVLTVHWLCGKVTEVPTGYNRMTADLRALRKTKEDGTAKTKRPKPEVRKITRKKKNSCTSGGMRKNNPECNKQ